LWQLFALIPGITSAGTGATVAQKPMPNVLTLEDPNMSGDLVTAVQTVVQNGLQAADFDPGQTDEAYEP
jgi:hypothetical protein